MTQLLEKRMPGPQRIAFATPDVVPGLKGCSGVARLGLCIRCDRLYQPGVQIAAQAVRVMGVYECINQVIGKPKT
jgi:hypothetical protein